LIIGSMAFDHLELPSGNFFDVVGGSATYAAMAASVFAPVRIVAVVGDDFSGEVLHDMRNRGIDTNGVERVPGKTFRWAGRYSKDLTSRETLDTQLNVFAEFRPRLPEAWRQTPLLLLGNIHPTLQTDVLDQLRVAPRPDGDVAAEHGGNRLAAAQDRDVVDLRDRDAGLAGDHGHPLAVLEVIHPDQIKGV